MLKTYSLQWDILLLQAIKQGKGHRMNQRMKYILVELGVVAALGIFLLLNPQYLRTDKNTADTAYLQRHGVRMQRALVH